MPSAHDRLAALIGGMPQGSVDALAEALESRRVTLVSSSVGLSQIRGLSQESAMRTARVFAELGNSLDEPIVAAALRVGNRLRTLERLSRPELEIA